MGRLVNPPTSATAFAEGTTGDDYTSRLIKYLPAESVAVFVAANTLIVNQYGLNLDGTSTKAPDTLLFWSSLLVLLVVLALTPYYLWTQRKGRPNALPSDWLNIAISEVSFVIWAYGIGGAFFLVVHWYQPLVGGLLTLLATFVLPAIKAPPTPPAS